MARVAHSPVQIRILVPTDAAAFQALRLAGLRECPSAFASSFDEECDISIARIAERLAPQDDRAVFGAFEGTGFVGMVGLKRESPRKLAHKAHLWGMYVVPAAREHGVGRQLVDAALAFAGTQLRVRQVNLGVNVANAAAIALYRGLGFSQYGLERGSMQVDGELQDEMLMVRMLDDAT
jgi:RimJ/RimL family protein N-acetyltransferase